MVNAVELLKKHPDMLMEHLEECSVYKVMDNGKIIEQWRKVDNTWIDETPEVLEEQRIRDEIAALEKRLKYVK